MKSRYPKKFLFTQLSAPIVGFGSWFLVLILIKDKLRSLIDSNFYSIFLKISIYIVLFIFVVMVSMLIWGRILVLLGIMTKEEAKGYPYSTPWKK
jgi:hypothetical protein